MKEIQKCSSCGDELDEQEIDSPHHDRDGSILCDDCYEEKYEHYCPICENYFYEDLTAKITPKYLLITPTTGDYVGLDSGIYEIISYPFYADGIIELHIFKYAVKRICDVPYDFEDCSTMYYICDECKAQVEKESTTAWVMRGM